MSLMSYRDQNIHFLACEVQAFLHTDFLKPANILLCVSDVAPEIRRQQFKDFRTGPWITITDEILMTLKAEGTNKSISMIF